MKLHFEFQKSKYYYNEPCLESLILRTLFLRDIFCAHIALPFLRLKEGAVKFVTKLDVHAFMTSISYFQSVLKEEILLLHSSSNYNHTVTLYVITLF